MAITGHLAEFSLAEIFQFLDQGHKTGLLTITPLPTAADTPPARSHYIWFQQGRVVAAAHRSDGQGLTSLIDQRGWMGEHAIERLVQTCPEKTPLGIYLKSQGLLDAEQLKLLFYVQVMRQVCALFALADAWFHFEGQAQMPVAELTGLNAPATEVTLAGLRALRDWRALEAKLPNLDSALLALTPRRPSLKLNQLEWRVWEFTQGDLALKDIAAQLDCGPDKLRQAAFRLIVVGLVEEIPLVPAAPPVPPTPGAAGDGEPAAASPADDAPDDSTAAAASPPSPRPGQQQVSHSFLQNLVGFLSSHA
jgi:hypothetical protein